MARITYKTTYSLLSFVDDSTISGTFVIIKFRGVLFFYDDNTEKLYPVSGVTRATVA